MSENTVTKTFRVCIWMLETAQPIEHDAVQTYTKGPLFCVLRLDGWVVKYPLIGIFRVVEEYGEHA